MTPDQSFQIAQSFALLGWACLMLAPLGRTQLIFAARLVAVILALAYVLFLFTATEPTGGDFSTLEGVTLLFSRPGNVLLGWTHYLAFDLLIGSWEAQDAPESGVPHWLLILLLFTTLMLGPLGWLAYLGVRTFTRRRTEA